VRRLRRAQGDERQQLKWFVYAAALLAAALAVDGYDPRGMGGFLSGLSPSLERDHPDRRVRRLTELGRKRAAHWRDLYGRPRSAPDPHGKRQTRG